MPPETETRPIFAVPGITEDDARWFATHAVLQVTYRWEYTSVDSVREWLDLWVHEPGEHSAFGTHLIVARSVMDIPVMVVFNKKPSGNQGLFSVPPYARDKILEIDRWDKAHASEIAEYERLRVKLGKAV